MSAVRIWNGSFLELDLVAIAPQFTAPKVNFEVSDREAR